MQYKLARSLPGLVEQTHQRPYLKTMNISVLQPGGLTKPLTGRLITMVLRTILPGLVGTKDTIRFTILMEEYSIPVPSLQMEAILVSGLPPSCHNRRQLCITISSTNPNLYRSLWSLGRLLHREQYRSRGRKG